MASPPALGEVAPGQLLVDPQSLTIWVGVDPSIAASGALLVSDMQALAAADVQVLADAKTYTNQMLDGTLAPGGHPYTQVGHKHVAADITDFAAAAAAAIGTNLLPKGSIILWSGDGNDVGQDNSPIGADLTAWAICNGIPAINGYATPDLTKAFILGAEKTTANTTNDPLSPRYDASRSTLSKSEDHILTVTEMPAHTHPFSNQSAGNPWLMGNTQSSNTYSVSGGSAAAQVLLGYAGGGLGHKHDMKPAVNVALWYKLCYIIKVI